MWNASRNTVLFVTHSITEAVLAVGHRHRHDVAARADPQHRSTSTCRVRAAARHLRDRDSCELSARVRDGIECSVGGIAP